MKKVEKKVTGKQLVALLKKRGVSCDIKQFEKMKHGAFLIMIRNLEKQIETYYFLKKIFIKPIELAYSNMPNRRSGKEILISNFELPKFKK